MAAFPDDTADRRPPPPPAAAILFPAGGTVPATAPGARRARITAASSGVLRRDALLIAIASMVFVYVWQLQAFFPVIRVLKPAVLTTLPAALLWFGNGDARRKLDRLRGPIWSLLVALVVMMLVTVPTSYWLGKSARFMVLEFPLILAFMVFVATSIRGVRDLEWFALIQLSGAVLFAVIRLARFGGGGDARFGTGTYDPNDIALMMVCTMPFAIYFIRKQVRAPLRLGALAALLLLTFVLVKTASRGGFLAFVVTMLYILFQFRAIKKSTRLLAAVVGLVVMVGVGSEAFWERIETIVHPADDYNFQENVLAGRVAVWKRGVGYMLANPLLGVGVRCFSVAEGASDIAVARAREGMGFKWSVAHNSFVEIGAELGIVGLVLFVSIFLKSIRSLTRLRKLPPEAGVTPAEAAMGETLVASLLGFMVAGFFLSQAYYAILYFLFAMVLGLTKLHPEALRGPARRRRG